MIGPPFGDTLFQHRNWMHFVNEGRFDGLKYPIDQFMCLVFGET